MCSVLCAVFRTWCCNFRQCISRVRYQLCILFLLGKMGKGKMKISQVKRSNHMRNKLHVRRTRKSSGVCFGMLNVKNRKSFPVNILQKTLESDENQDLECEDIRDMVDIDITSWNIAKVGYDWESEYEGKLNKEKEKHTKLLLPIKTKDGLVLQTTEVDELEEQRKEFNRQVADKQKLEERMKKKKEKAIKKKRSKLGKQESISSDEREDDDSHGQGQENDKSYREENDSKLLEEGISVENGLSEGDVLRRLQFQIGVLCAGLLETPEMKIRNFEFLFDILQNNYSSINTTVHKLVIASLLEVFKDILPSYPIKHREANTKLKKSTLQLRNFENSLLKAYKTYLQKLEKMSQTLKSKHGFKGKSVTEAESLGVLAVRCFCELLVEHPYFNFSANIARGLIVFLTHPVQSVSNMVVRSICKVLREDKKGELSLNIVRSINYIFIKKRSKVRPEVISVLLAIKFRDINMDDEKEAEIQAKKLKNRKFKVLSMSKRDRKRSKQLEELEREMRETKAEENKVERKKKLTEIMNIIFKIFFHVLKRNSQDSKLLSVTLEGLAKFAHCINLEFFHDLVNVLNELLSKRSMNLLQRLHCVETVFIILSGQGEALNIDPHSFYSHLYCCLLDVHIASMRKECTATIKILEKAIGARRRKMSLLKLLAFSKRMSTMIVNLSHGDALGIIKMVLNILLQTKACNILLDPEPSCGNGVYLPEGPDPEFCGADSTVMWELCLLNHHYHPEVQRMADAIINVEADGFQSSEFSKLSAAQIADMYDCSQMVFRPPVPLPKKVISRPHRGRVVLTSDEMALYVENTKKSVMWPND